VDLSDVDPDTVRTVAYEKGLYFLRTVEHAVGRARWDAFLTQYFDTFSFQSMTTPRFVSYLERELVDGNGDLRRAIGIDDWVYGPGIPDNVRTVTSTELRRSDAQREAFVAGTAATQLDTTGWTTHHWLRFLRRLPLALETSRMTDLDRTFKLSQSGNSEILSAWLQRVVASEYVPGYPALDRFLTDQGRLKFLLPLYQGLARSPNGRSMALEIYERARPRYHPISQGVIDRILGIN
jgi:hypothetical protein